MIISQPRLATAALAAVFALACTGTPHVDGEAGTSPAPNALWKPPAHRDSAAAQAAPLTLPPDMQAHIDSLTLGDVVDSRCGTIPPPASRGRTRAPRRPPTAVRRATTIPPSTSA